MGLSQFTVRDQLRCLSAKLDASDRTGGARVAIEQGLIVIQLKNAPEIEASRMTEFIGPTSISGTEMIIPNLRNAGRSSVAV